jgi:hypothetical protein
VRHQAQAKNLDRQLQLWHKCQSAWMLDTKTGMFKTKASDLQVHVLFMDMHQSIQDLPALFFG